MAYEMIKLTGNETKEQLLHLKDNTALSIAALENYISVRNDYFYELDCAIKKIEETEDLL